MRVMAATVPLEASVFVPSIVQCTTLPSPPSSLPPDFLPLPSTPSNPPKNTSLHRLYMPIFATIEAILTTHPLIPFSRGSCRRNCRTQYLVLRKTPTRINTHVRVKLILISFIHRQRIRRLGVNLRVVNDTARGPRQHPHTH